MRAHATRVAAVLGALLVAFVVLPISGAFADRGIRTPGAAELVDSTLRYGCSNGGWVELQLRTVPASAGSTQAATQTVQVGYTTNGTDADAAYPTGGPLQVNISNQVTLVRLAGAPPAGASVFMHSLTTGEVTTVALPAACSSTSWPHDFRLAPVLVTAAPAVCVSPSAASVAVAVANPNAHRTVGGPGDVDYTVLAVDAHGTLLNGAGQLLAFNSAGPLAATVQVPGAGGAYSLRVIGMDGSVVTVSGTAPDCTPVVTPPTPTKSSVPPTSSEPPSSTPLHTPPPHVTPSGQSPAPSATQTSSAPQPVVSVSATPSRAKPKPSPSASPSTTPVTPTPSHSQPPKQLPLLAAPDSHPAFRLQPTAALVVVADALAIGALVFGTMQIARRR